MSIKPIKAIDNALVEVGKPYFLLYCGRPIGVVGKIKAIEVTKITRTAIHMANGIKVAVDGSGMYSLAFVL